MKADPKQWFSGRATPDPGGTGETMEQSLAARSGGAGTAASSRRPTSPSAQGGPHTEPPEVGKPDVNFSFSSLGSTCAVTGGFQSRPQKNR